MHLQNEVETATMRGILKRKFEDGDDSPSYSSSSPPSPLSSPASSEWESDRESSSPDSQDFTPHSPSSATTLPSESPNPQQQQQPYSLLLFQMMQTSLFFPVGVLHKHLLSACSSSAMKMLVWGQL